MDIKVKKDSYIKVRVSKEQKELFKRVAKKKGMTMTDLLVVDTEERALKEELKLDGTELLENRVDEVERKLQEIKCKMENQRTYKKSFLKIFLSRFMNLTKKASELDKITYYLCVLHKKYYVIHTNTRQ